MYENFILYIKMSKLRDLSKLTEFSEGGVKRIREKGLSKKAKSFLRICFEYGVDISNLSTENYLEELRDHLDKCEPKFKNIAEKCDIEIRSLYNLLKKPSKTMKFIIFAYHEYSKQIDLYLEEIQESNGKEKGGTE